MFKLYYKLQITSDTMILRRDVIKLDSGSQQVLDWKQRHDIITGIAKGLVYLHEGAHTCVIHRDIKASNILLDDKWVPKISDFGMARLFPEDQSHVNTRVAGTKYVVMLLIFVFSLTVMVNRFGILCHAAELLIILTSEQWLHSTRVSHAW